MIKSALAEKDFVALGQASERNAIAMHATMLKATPAISYSNAKTAAWMQQVWQLRQDNMPVYFTQDAGPNLKLLFLEDISSDILQLFPDVEIIEPFSMHI
jgi:diphosphomevalonate decarboxylase